MLNNKGVGRPADVYQLGAVLYEMLVGLPPFFSNNIRDLYKMIKKEELQIPKIVSP